MPNPKINAQFIEPMLLLSTEKLPEGGSWTYELKLDGFRAEAITTGGRVHLRSRNDKDLAPRSSTIAQALAAMPDETVIDGEIVALEESGRPSFSAFQHQGAKSKLKGSWATPDKPLVAPNAQLCEKQNQSRRSACGPIPAGR